MFYFLALLTLCWESVAVFWQYLSQCVVGATLQPAEEEEEEVAEDIDEEQELDESKAITYEIIGTLSDPLSQKPDFVREIVKVHFICFCYHAALA